MNGSFVLSARFCLSVMSEAVGACILSSGKIRGAIGDAAELEDFFEKVDVELYSICMSNIATASDVLEKVLFPFFQQKYSEHLLIGIFHGKEDGSWILAGHCAGRIVLRF